MTITDAHLECSFCGRGLQADVPVPELTELGPLGSVTAPLDPGWKILYSGTSIPTVICSSCLPTLTELSDALEQGIQQLLNRLAHRRPA